MDELLSRFRVVLDEWERKGGDAKKYRAYEFERISSISITCKQPFRSEKLGAFSTRWHAMGRAFGFIRLYSFASWMLSRVLSRISGEAFPS